MRLLTASLVCALALAGEPVPAKFAGLSAIRWAGELADPFSDDYAEARWEHKVNSLPHERMQFYYGDAPSAEAHVDAAQRSVPKELLSADATPDDVERLRAAAALAEAAKNADAAVGVRSLSSL